MPNYCPAIGACQFAFAEPVIQTGIAECVPTWRRVGCMQKSKADFTGNDILDIIALLQKIGFARVGQINLNIQFSIALEFGGHLNQKGLTAISGRRATGCFRFSDGLI